MSNKLRLIIIASLLGFAMLLFALSYLLVGVLELDPSSLGEMRSGLSGGLVMLFAWLADALGIEKARKDPSRPAVADDQTGA